MIVFIQEFSLGLGLKTEYKIPPAIRPNVTINEILIGNFSKPKKYAKNDLEPMKINTKASENFR